MEILHATFDDTGHTYSICLENDEGDIETLEYFTATPFPDDLYTALVYLGKKTKICEESRVKRNEEWNHKLQRVLNEMNYKPLSFSPDGDPYERLANEIHGELMKDSDQKKEG